MDQDRSKKEIKYFLDFNENKCKAYTKLRGTMKLVLRGQFIALRNNIMKFE